MSIKRTCWMGIAGWVLVAQLASGMGFGLGETKEELGLDYAVVVTDHGTGRVSVVLTIADEGRLAPLNSVDLFIANQDGTNHVDLSVTLDRREVNGKQVVRVHLLKSLAKRAKIQLKTSRLDGEQTPLTWYYHAIPLADAIDEAARKKADSPLPKSAPPRSGETALPAAASEAG